MNTQIIRFRFIPAFCAVALLSAFAGCSDRGTASNPPAERASKTEEAQNAVGEAWDKTKSAVKETYADMKDAVGDGVEKLDRATYDERAEIKASLAEAGAKLDAELVDWTREGKTINAAAKEKLASAKTAFDNSLDQLGSATAEGWEAAKAKAAAAWADLKAAYAAAKAEHSS